MTFNEVLSKLGDVHQKMNGHGYSDLISFDFKKKRISNGKTILFDNGKIIPQKIKLNDTVLDITEDMIIEKYSGDTFEKLEELYNVFRTSIPEPYSSYSNSKFIAKNIDDLTYTEFNNGCKRQKARIDLESFVMFNKFNMLNEKHHYRQSQKYPSLVLYRDWVN